MRYPLLLLTLSFISTVCFAANKTATTSPRPKNLLYHSTPYQQSGVMLGGIGSGYIELLPDGSFPDWGIFNRGRWAYRGDYMDSNQAAYGPLDVMNNESLLFYIRTQPQKGGRPIARRLGTVGSHMNVYSYNTWLQNVESIDADATFPGITLYYKDPTLPVKVSAQFFSPIIPHDLKTSATPGFYAVFTITNTSEEAQTVSLASYFRNPIARSRAAADRAASARKLKTSIENTRDRVSLTMSSDSETKYINTLGTMTISMLGGEPSWIGMDYGDYLLGRTVTAKGWNQRYETPMRSWRTNGELPNTNPQNDPINIVSAIYLIQEQMIGGQYGALTDSPAAKRKFARERIRAQRESIRKLTPEQIEEILRKSSEVASLQSILQQAKDVDPSYLDPQKRGRELADIISQILTQYSGEKRLSPTWGDNMLNSKIELQPGESKEIKFILTWHFPNHISPITNKNMGHMYANFFKDSKEVNDFMIANFGKHRKAVDEFRSILRDNTLPVKLNQAISAQLSTLICSSWWDARNLAGIWEGLGTMGMNPATCYEHGSHLVAALFPEFQKLITANSVRYQNNKTGRMYILLPNDLTNGRTNMGWGYVDRNSHFVWMIGRDYLWFNDREMLKRLYPRIVLSMSVFGSPEMDTDGDGLTDTHTSSNTYDTWELNGNPSYMASLWIVALRSAIRMAEDYGDEKNAVKWKSVLNRAIQSMENKLWNGEYYSLWINEKTRNADGSIIRDEGCMVDQIIGEYYSRLMGMGNNLDPNRIRGALDSIFKYNFDPDHGLHNGIYPRGRQPRMPTYHNVQGEGNWTGIEYNAVAMFIDHGLVDEGLQILDAVHQRYMRAGRYSNHHECGDRYIRPMSIWAALLAATGYKIDAPRGILTIAPPIRQERMLAPWVSATGLGNFVRTGNTFEMRCLQGEMPIKELRLNCKVSTGVLNGEKLSLNVSQENDLTVLRFDTPITLKTGQCLEFR